MDSIDQLFGDVSSLLNTEYEQWAYKAAADGSFWDAFTTPTNQEPNKQICCFRDQRLPPFPIEFNIDGVTYVAVPVA